jgi:hypothetical protein
LTNPRLRVHVRSKAPPVFEVDRYEDHPRLKVNCVSENPSIFALLLLLPAGRAEPEVTFTELDRSVQLKLTWPERTDLVTWPHEGDRKPVIRFLNKE